VATPDAATGDSDVNGVAALEANHAVGVGDGGFIQSVSPDQGTTWNLLAGGGSSIAALSPSPADENILNSVDMSSGKLFAVGFDNAATLAWAGTFDSGTHTLTWAGSPTTSANPSVTFNDYFAVAAISPSVFWATGFESVGSVAHTLAEVYCGLVLNLAAPATAYAGAPFSMTVTAENPNFTTKTSYDGTVHFTSSDAHAVLPPDYTFVPADAGSHIFSGVVLLDPNHPPTTITVVDKATPFVTATASITVTCSGPCPSPAGSSGGRGAGQSPPGTSGGRGTSQSPPGSPGPRISRQRPPSASAPRLPKVKPAASTSETTVKTRIATVAAVNRVTSSTSVRTSALGGAHCILRLASTTTPVQTTAMTIRNSQMAPAHDDKTWYLMYLLPLAMVGLVLLIMFARARRDAG
jgi:hypothetical protein